MSNGVKVVLGAIAGFVLGVGTMFFLNTLRGERPEPNKSGEPKPAIEGEVVENPQNGEQTSPSNDPITDDIQKSKREGSGILTDIRIREDETGFSVQADEYGLTEFAIKDVEEAVEKMKKENLEKTTIRSIEHTDITFYLEKPSNATSYNDIQEQYLEGLEYYYVDYPNSESSDNYLFLVKEDGAFFLKHVQIAGQDGYFDVYVLQDTDLLDYYVDYSTKAHFITPGLPDDIEVIVGIGYYMQDKDGIGLGDFNLYKSKLEIKDGELFFYDDGEYPLVRYN